MLAPTKCIEYVGNNFDSESMLVKLPEHRIVKFLHGCKQLSSKNCDKIREVPGVTGLLVAALPAVELGNLPYRKLETAKVAVLESYNGNFDKWMLVTDKVKKDLAWWMEHVESQQRRSLYQVLMLTYTWMLRPT